jgi:hypothetical protein
MRVTVNPGRNGVKRNFDAGERAPWAGMVTGAVVGLCFGLAFGGLRPSWFAALFGPASENGH